MSESNPGDPSGRRIARRRALLLSEAGRILHSAEVLLKRAEVDPTACSELIKNLAEQERIQLQRAYGRIESRSRFKKGSSHPLLEKRLISNLYIDEGGKSNTEPGDNPTFFSLAAVAMAAEEVEKYRSAADEINREFFGTVDITFHEPDMRMREGAYYFDGDVMRQAKFDAEIDKLVCETNFVTFGVGIRKCAFNQEFVKGGLDPYLPVDVYSVAIILLLERYIDYLATRATKRIGRVTYESQGPLEDAWHQLEHARVLIDGSQWVSPSSFRNWLEPGLRFTPKQGSDPMELADMFARDLYEWIRGDCQDKPKRWGQFRENIYCRGDGRMGKFGVKVFPDSDIRERIEAHRIWCGAKCEN